VIAVDHPASRRGAVAPFNKSNRGNGSEQMELKIKQKKLFIGGEWCDAQNGKTWDVINPSTEDVVTDVPFGGGDDCKAAIDAAQDAFPAWSRKTPYERAEVLMKAAALIRERVDELYPINSAESGKPKGDAQGDLLAAAALFEWYAEEGKRAYGHTIPARKPDKRMIVIQQPLGVVGIITAWNFPAYNPARAMAAALAAGCTIVVKPSEYTPLTCMELVGILQEAGAPDGVVNLVLGDADQIGTTMLEDPRCRKIGFTGSVRVGKILMDGASKTVTRLGLELGGNAPVIILPDADIDALAAAAPMAKCRNVGQVCVSPQRFFLHESVRDEFVEKVVPGIEQLVVGRSDQNDVQVGPLINARQRDHVESLVDAAKQDGVDVATGGKRPEQLDKGYFYEPTVLANISPEAPIANEEIFGPVMPVIDFSEVEQVIEQANRTHYGLAAYVFTNQLNTAIKIAEGLEFGMVGVNEWTPQALEAPFIGWKQSGIGMECGREGLEDYMESKLIGIGGLDY
jgi:succinate-semialdehyde dehydrogenase